MNSVNTLLKNVFEKVIDYDIIYRNPCKRITAPRRHKPNRRSLTAEQGGDLLSVVNECEDAAYAELDEKDARRACREGHGIAKERRAVRGIHGISCIVAVRIGLAAGQRRVRCSPSLVAASASTPRPSTWATTSPTATT